MILLSLNALGKMMIIYFNTLTDIKLNKTMKKQIKSQDLRLGNYIYGVSYRIEKVISLGVNFLTTGFDKIELQNTNEYSDVFGIPISPEILEKSGFTQAKNFQKGVLSLNGVRMIYHNGQWQWNDLTRNKGVLYLHQLQNLYFSLAGQELNINL